MGPVNWIAVVVAGLAGALVLHLIEGRQGGTRRLACLALVMLVASAMLGHALARIGVERLAARPWLFFMQSGGLAAAFVVPALFVNGVKLPLALGWLAAYLAMGGAFWLLG
ncbi:MAG: DUF1761 domain-containing protein [Novosphingobium sp.]|uniref:DUF1761 domain-containing protein n=1 Tax=Novosphingobium sp. TaxID=1874826 RepID=UPI003C7C32E3